MLIQYYQNLIKTAIFGPVKSDVLAMVNFKSVIFWYVCVFVTPCSLQNVTVVADKPVERQYISNTLQGAACHYDLDLPFLFRFGICTS